MLVRKGDCYNGPYVKTNHLRLIFEKGARFAGPQLSESEVRDGAVAGTPHHVISPSNFPDPLTRPRRREP